VRVESGAQHSAWGSRGATLKTRQALAEAIAPGYTDGAEAAEVDGGQAGRTVTSCPGPSFCHNAKSSMARHIEAADLPEDIARTAEAQVAAGRFASVEDVVRAGVEAIATLEQRRVAVRAALQEGELSGVFEGDAFASVRAELGLTRQ